MGAGHGHPLYVHGHSKVHGLAPEVKVATLVLFVVAVATTPPVAVWAFGLYALMVGAVIRVARLPLKFVATRLLVIVPFVLFALALPFIGTGPKVEILGLAVAREGLWGMWNILAKAGLGATASIVLTGTTEVPDVLKGLGRLRVPAVFVAITGFMVRYLEVIADELKRMRIAMTARGYDPRWLWQAKPIAASTGALFVRSYERGERVYDAMVARGFSGEMPSIVQSRPGWSEWLAGLTVAALAVAVAVAAWAST